MYVTPFGNPRWKRNATRNSMMPSTTPSRTDRERLAAAFALAFGLEPGTDVSGYEYGQVEAWDSTAHMILIAEIELAFNIMLSSDDVIDMSSFSRAEEIVAKYVLSSDAA